MAGAFVGVGGRVPDLSRGVRGLRRRRCARSPATQGTAGIFATYPQPFLSLGRRVRRSGRRHGAADGRRASRISDSKNAAAPAGWRPLLVGALVVAIGVAFGFNAGYAINPARDLGPRLFTAVAAGAAASSRPATAGGGCRSSGRIVGAVLGGLVYDAVHHPAARHRERAMSRFVLALDQGTTSSRAIVFDHDGRGRGQRAAGVPADLPAARPRRARSRGDLALAAARRRARRSPSAGATAADIAAIGVTNQRETTVLWDRATGKPVANAIVWQSRITAPICDRLKADGHEPLFREKTGLVVDAYFSGTKIKHLLDTIRRPARARRARRDAVRHHRHVPDLAAHRRARARHRRQQRQPHAALQHPHAATGTTSC